MKKIDIVTYPNFSIILPGPCNAKCAFCTWTEVKTESKYLKRVNEVVHKLPDYFVSISITGGEPIMSPYLWDVLDLIDKNRWERVVLTTNGCFLTKDVLKKLVGKIDFINISRHHYSDDINNKLFGINTVPTTYTLQEICTESYRLGIPISFNCVLSKYFLATKEETEKFIDFAYNMGTRSVSFRKPQGPTSTTAPTKHELLYIDDRTYVNHPCPVCRTGTATIKNFPVTWKSAVLEPSHHLNGTWFEAVLHPTGILSGDWAGTMVGEPKQFNHIEEEPMSKIRRSELKKLIEVIVNEVLDNLEEESTPKVRRPKTSTKTTSKASKSTTSKAKSSKAKKPKSARTRPGSRWTGTCPSVATGGC